LRVISHRAIVDAARRHPGPGSGRWAFGIRYAQSSLATSEPTQERFSARGPAGNAHCIQIKRNRYRLIARVNYLTGQVFVLGIWTHAEYDKGRLAQMSVTAIDEKCYAKLFDQDLPQAIRSDAQNRRWTAYLGDLDSHCDDLSNEEKPWPSY
jgi:mRNA-degrading endonuclease HigB of HigAB toxin-antitoxin module